MRTEDDLRDALRLLEQQAPAPADVLRMIDRRAAGAARRPGQRPPAWRRPLQATLAAAATAVVAVVAVNAVFGGPRFDGPRVTPRLLRARLVAAIETARGDILYAHAPSQAGGTWAWPWYPQPGQRVEMHVLGLTAQGLPAKDAEFIFTMPGRAVGNSSANPIDWGGLTVTGTAIEVDHARHTWGEWQQDITAGLPLNAAAIRAEVASGRLQVIGTTEIAGRQAIELGMTLPAGRGAALRVTTARLWVSAQTYLPTRMLLRFSGGKQTVTDYTFLPPTQANLAKLRAEIPPGYQRTALHPDQRAVK